MKKTFKNYKIKLEIFKNKYNLIKRQSQNMN